MCTTISCNGSGIVIIGNTLLVIIELVKELSLLIFSDHSVSGGCCLRNDGIQYSPVDPCSLQLCGILMTNFILFSYANHTISWRLRPK